ncbi:hypothetical protein SASPL_126990 [Salvia splendens]|uniref:Uncharacterized protein n=1 Tax=Salvia splendens TaxID=180675 RepID=A0A8X8ZQI5_SALSN|nr:hypothetical protein SASPL_126990 [Salvia splendens]
MGVACDSYPPDSVGAAPSSASVVSRNCPRDAAVRDRPHYSDSLQHRYHRRFSPLLPLCAWRRTGAAASPSE